MSKHDPLVTLQQMRANCEEILFLVKGKSKTNLESDRVLSLAVVRLMELLGEAATRIPDEIRQENSKMPWIQMIGLRNRLIHGYDDIDFDVIWNVISKDIPLLLDQLSSLVNTR